MEFKPDTLGDSLILRAGAAIACLLAAFFVALVAVYGTLILSSTRCEDYGIGCHGSRPVFAMLVGLTGGVAALSLAAMGVSAVVADGGRFRRTALVGAAAIGLFLAVLALNRLTL